VGKRGGVRSWDSGGDEGDGERAVRKGIGEEWGEGDIVGREIGRGGERVRR